MSFRLRFGGRVLTIQVFLRFDFRGTGIAWIPYRCLRSPKCRSGKERGGKPLPRNAENVRERPIRLGAQVRAVQIFYALTYQTGGVPPGPAVPPAVTESGCGSASLCASTRCSQLRSNPRCADITSVAKACALRQRWGIGRGQTWQCTGRSSVHFQQLRSHCSCAGVTSVAQGRVLRQSWDIGRGQGSELTGNQYYSSVPFCSFSCQEDNSISRCSFLWRLPCFYLTLAATACLDKSISAELTKKRGRSQETGGEM